MIQSAFGKFFSVIAWVFSGFGAFSKKNYKIDEITVYKVHNAFFLWAIILTGFLSAWIVGNYPGTAVFMGWLYIWVAMYTILAIIFDLGMLKLALATVIVGFIWISSAYLESVKSMHLLSGVFSYMGGLKPALSPGFVSVLSWLLLMPWVWSIFHAFSYGRITLSTNSIEEWHLGIGSEIFDRWGLKFRTRYDDLLESILGLGCGNLVAFNNEKAVKQYDNILMLFFWWPRLDELLHQRATVVDNAPDETVSVEEKACLINRSQEK